jgi:hypothetical protein
MSFFYLLFVQDAVTGVSTIEVSSVGLRLLMAVDQFTNHSLSYGLGCCVLVRDLKPRTTQSLFGDDVENRRLPIALVSESVSDCDLRSPERLVASAQVAVVQVVEFLAVEQMALKSVGVFADNGRFNHGDSPVCLFIQHDYFNRTLCAK